MGNETEDITKVEGYRLPTEAEWEYAARGGHEDINDGNEDNDYIYAGSNDLDEVGWYHGNSGLIIHEVGQKEPNEIGLYDMSGNVWELCQDWYDGGYYDNSPIENPINLESSTVRVMRGGDFYLDATFSRVAKRYGSPPAISNYNVGLRIARTQ
jgi:formylglycine-generating enzyme required for sulfatase activity